MFALRQSLLWLAVAAGSQSAAAEKSMSPWVIAPFVAVSRDVPARAGIKLASMLANELNGLEENAAVVTPSAPLPAENLTHAWQEQHKKWMQWWNAKQLRELEQSIAQELQRLEQGAPEAAAWQVLDGDTWGDLWVLRAAVAYLNGRDEIGAQHLATALAANPDRVFPLAADSPGFTREIDAVRSALLKGPKSTLEVERAPGLADLTIDGVKVGIAPLRITSFYPGKHVWRASWVDGSISYGVLDLPSDGKMKKWSVPFKATLATAWAASLFKNVSDGAWPQAVHAALPDVKSDRSIAGWVSKSGRGLKLELFAHQGKDTRRLPAMEFDVDLLSAGVELLNGAKKIHLGEGEGARGSAAPPPAHTAELAWPQTVKSQLHSAELDAGNKPAEPNDASSREPLQKSRAPLKR